MNPRIENLRRTVDNLAKNGKPFAGQLRGLNKLRRKAGLEEIQTIHLPRKQGKSLSQIKKEKLGKTLGGKKRFQKHKSSITYDVKRLNWKILPVGTDWPTFERHFDSLAKQGGKEIKQEEIDESRDRFKSIFELKPKTIYRGIESFSDYFALLFEETKKVVLESINYGNATYVIESDWKAQSRKTKSELRMENTKFIIHQRGWFSKLKNELQIGFE